MTIHRIALIYDDTLRRDTTGTYCLRALEKLAEAVHFRPDQLAAIPKDDFDLYLNVDDGLPYRLPPGLRPSAWWTIDTHLDFDRCRAKAPGFDFVFAAQRDGAERLRQEGIATAQWLPLACDPTIHRKHDVPRQYDVCFVGHLAPGDRTEAIRLLQSRFANAFVGQRYFEEMARTYSASRIVFNRSIRNDVNMRVFEALACGSLLVTNDLAENGQAELFRDGEHLVVYRDLDELVEKVAVYLNREDDRERIAAAGMREVVEHHTYRHRMETILRHVEAAMESHEGRAAFRKSEPGRVGPGGPGRRVRADRSYYELARPELVALIPPTARRVLDVGCAAGRLGQALKARQEARVCGIEIDPDAAGEAKRHLDQVIVGDLERLEVPFPEGHFDCIVCGDVLEHLAEPGRFLERARRWLAPDGCLVASIPNVRHHSVIRSLLGGDWTYEPAGLLDRTHLRFFTRREIEKLFYRAGFGLRRLAPNANADHEEWVRRGRPGSVCAGRLEVRGMEPDEAEEFHVVQYLVEAVPAPAAKTSLTSIVILTHNQLEYTRLCVESILDRTDEPIELVFVDNGSTDGTADYLRTMDGAKLIVNPENRGFPAGVNQGIGAASGRNILLLNNDVVVTTGWLGRLLRALDSAPDVGLVGPCSNHVSGPQQIPADYDDLAALDGFAWDHGKANAGRYRPVDRLVGFCLLIRREVIERIGLFDERFGVGCFEDDDFCRRAAAAGYRLLIAADAFVHHFGSRTFRASGVDLGRLLRENEKVYREKWQPTAADGPILGSGRKSVSLCMIVRDNARTIEACLDSIKPWVDEMVVVDTGSQDNTPELARACGARLFEFPWCDDFAAARNESLRHARGEWIFWMDSDDTIDPENGRKLRRQVDSAVGAPVLGYVMQVHCPGDGQDGKTEVTVVDHVKLFRNRLDLRFEGRIHEQILPSIRRADGEVAFTDIFVVHSGADHTPEGRRKKLDRDFRLLSLDLEDRPDHPFVLFNLGMTHADAGQHEQAVEALRRSITVSQPAESHVRKAYALLVGSLGRLGRYDEARQACRAGRRLYPDDVELLFREGVLCQHFGRWREAERAYLDLLDLSGPQYFASMDRGIRGFKARHNLALVYEALHELEKAESQWREVVAEEPTYRAGWRGLGEVLLRQGKLGAAETAVRQMLQGDPPLAIRSEAAILEGRIAETGRDFAAADRLLRETVAR
jgi:GT2 family glycosyltransferase/2-polyprenyl-3-methyl-5-hydroxy-6-metoxy-1,4-benzoquinol methylase/tetratricopeptide (TPR) repeat protein